MRPPLAVHLRPVPGYAYPARKLNIVQELIIAGVGAAMLVGVGFALLSLPLAAAPAQSHRSDLPAMIFLIGMFLPAGFACLCWRPVYVVDPVAKTLTHYRNCAFPRCYAATTVRVYDSGDSLQSSVRICLGHNAPSQKVRIPGRLLGLWQQLKTSCRRIRGTREPSVARPT